MVTEQSNLNTEVAVLLKLTPYSFFTVGNCLRIGDCNTNGEVTVPVR